MDSLRKWVWLTTLNGMCSEKITSLLDRFDSIDDIYSAKESDYKDIPLLRANDIKQLCNKSFDRAEEVIIRTEICGGYIIDFDSEKYPQSLKRLVNPPYVLYVKGSFDFSLERVGVGVVGTRKCSGYGQAVTSKLCSDLASSGFTVISGMALGVDSVAATAALRMGAQTIAVLGCGIDMTYPPSNEDLMGHIVNHGAVISEYPPMSQPFKTHFPERNRIIAALSDCLLVTEAPSSSGALITAKYAYEMGIRIYSVPGNIFMPNSVGTNLLIKAGAEPVLSSRDIIEEFELSLRTVKKPKPGENFITEKLKNEIKLENEEVKKPQEEKKPEEPEKKEVENVSIDDERFSSLSEIEKKLIELLIANQKMSVDELIRASGLTTKDVNSVLPLLEIGGLIKKYAGNFYTLADN